MKVAVEYEFRSAGSLRLGVDGKLEFPALPVTPGVYQLDFKGGNAPALYVGETDNLKRRSGNYRNPGPRQRTSLRINARLLSHLREGGAVEMSITTTARIELAGQWDALDLTSKAARLLVESSALLLAKKAAVQVENL